MNFDFEFAIATVPIILSGFFTTIWVTVIGSIGPASLGFTLEIMRRLNRPLHYIMQFLIDAIRSTPLLVQIYFVILFSRTMA